MGKNVNNFSTKTQLCEDKRLFFKMKRHFEIELCSSEATILLLLADLYAVSEGPLEFKDANELALTQEAYISELNSNIHLCEQSLQVTLV